MGKTSSGGGSLRKEMVTATQCLQKSPCSPMGQEQWCPRELAMAVSSTM